MGNLLEVQGRRVCWLGTLGQWKGMNCNSKYIRQKTSTGNRKLAHQDGGLVNVAVPGIYPQFLSNHNILLYVDQKKKGERQS